MDITNVFKDSELDYVEIELIHKLLMIKYETIFTCKSAYDIAVTLYMNGIRKWMFFDNVMDIDEIVGYLVNKGKIREFCSKNTNDSSVDRIVDGDNNECKMISFYDYFVESKIMKRKIRK